MSNLIDRARKVGLLDDLLCDNCEAVALSSSIKDCGTYISYKCAQDCHHVSMLDEQIIEEAGLAL